VTRRPTGLRSLRWRLTAVATTTLAVVLIVTGIALVAVQRRQLIENVDSTLEQRADEIELTLADRTLDDTVPEVPEVLAGTNVEDRFAQLVTLDGQVLAASTNVAGEPAVAPPPRGRQTARTVEFPSIEDDDFRLFSRRVEFDGQPAVLHVAENIDDVTDSTRVLAAALIVSFPALVALLGGLTWWLVGRTLRPVEAAARKQQRFVADASHELRSPLTRIRTRLEVDLAHPSGVDFRETARDVLDDSTGMERLVDDLLHLARSDAASTDDGRREPVDVDDVVLMEAATIRADARVRVDTSAVSAGQVIGDMHQLTRMVRNLLDNAVRHATTAVRIDLHERDDNVVLSVADDGPGIPLDQRDVVFERFTRLDAARTASGGGVGLGLAIARDIAERHGGTITVGDAHPGAVFTVRLPASRDPARSVPDPATVRTENGVSSRRRRRARR
jgi:signal transduction histidine kinase